MLFKQLLLLTCFSMISGFIFHRRFALHRGLRLQSSLSVHRAHPTSASPATVIDRRTPITVLSGFLGSGKTTFLQQVLNRDTQSKIGLLVNDVASVNIDSKLVKRENIQKGSLDMLELQNGCVCCSLADDMIASIREFARMASHNASRYDHILLECSGIAEPRRVRELFREAAETPNSGLESVRLDTLLTVVDAKVFFDLFGKQDTFEAHQALAAPAGAVVDESAAMRSVTELLLEQVECADIVLINKIDLLASKERDIEVVKSAIRGMNPFARIEVCEYGRMEDPIKLIGKIEDKGVGSLDVVQEHKRSVAATKSHSHHASAHAHDHHDLHSHDKHDHDHDHHHSSNSQHGEDIEACHVEHVCTTKCTSDHHDYSHDHCTNPSHDHSHEGTATTSTTHTSTATCGHEHEPGHVHTEACFHDHNHSHDGHACTHDHHHDHEHHADSASTTARDRFGITSFVYTRRRPFHPKRLFEFLQSVGRLSVDSMANMTELGSGSAPDHSAKSKLLRAKGFVWISSSSALGYYLSQAGQYIEMQVLGNWWADIPKADWPTDEAAVREIMADFDGSNGDRRQELIFIGQLSEDSEARRELEKTLDACLLTDAEMDKYTKIVAQGAGDDGLRKEFVE